MMAAQERELLMDGAEVTAAIQRLAGQVAAVEGEPLVFVGIHSRGVPLAARLAAEVSRLLGGAEIPAGTLDITQHRDDLGTLGAVPQLVGSDIPFDIDGARVLLCDEVIHTGRSIRAALSELLDFGRPARVELAVLVDRGGREFPIQPDFTAAKVELAADRRVAVRFVECDGEDAVWIEFDKQP
jgi:pyrimidine operon attenuation protein/uracil phosphoribosyltransferase